MLDKTFTLKTSARIALAIASAFPLAVHAIPAGRVDFVIGNVTALASDGRSRALTKGGDINSGETISCGDGRVQLRFTDGSQVSLLPGTQYRIDDYKFNGQSDGEEKGVFSLLKGGFRTITGLIGKANKQAYKVNTSTATIGIRGTEFLVLDDKDGVTVSTGDGQVQVCSAGGCIILTAGESAVVRDKNGQPVRVFNLGIDSTNDKPDTPSVKIDYASSDNGLQAVLPKLPSGPDYAFAYAANYLDGGEGPGVSVYSHLSGTANFNDQSVLLAYSTDGGEGVTYTNTGVANGLTDGIIGWGLWSSMDYSYNSSNPPYSSPHLATHYVVGTPTSTTELQALYVNNLVGEYSLMGATLPTSMDSSTGAITLGSGVMSGKLTANFGSGSVNFALSNINVGGVTYGIQGSGSMSAGAAQFSGGVGAAAGTTQSVCGSFSGLFFGANAARAGLTYGFNDYSSNSIISGAAAFKQTGLAAGGYVQ